MLILFAFKFLFVSHFVIKINYLLYVSKTIETAGEGNRENEAVCIAAEATYLVC